LGDPATKSGATRPDGKNLKDKGLFDKPELNWRKYKDD
jgi:hypothetical protein